MKYHESTSAFNKTRVFDIIFLKFVALEYELSL